MENLSPKKKQPTVDFRDFNNYEDTPSLIKTVPTHF